MKMESLHQHLSVEFVCAKVKSSSSGQNLILLASVEKVHLILYLKQAARSFMAHPVAVE